MWKQRKDLSNQRFGRWTVLAFSHRGHKNAACWLVRCDCGNEKTVSGEVLRDGRSKSCGCLVRELTALRNKTTHHGRPGIPHTHGATCSGQRSREYRSWESMKARCTNPNDDHWKDYGGRGIMVCERWLHSFENFFADMGPRPAGTTLDRKNTNGNYEPSNCRWATDVEQANNRRSPKRVNPDQPLLEMVA